MINYTTNIMQTYFVHWNAERLGISIEESTERFEKSFNAVKGHESGTFKEFCETSHNLFIPFFSDDEDSVIESYKFHSYMHFLRMLASMEHNFYDYFNQTNRDEHDIVLNHLLSVDGTINIFDYGCGLAQYSISYARLLKDRNRDVKLHLIDIPTIREDFLTYVCDALEIQIQFYRVKDEKHYFPDIELCDFGVAVEVFEHLYEPEIYFKKINNFIKKDAVILTNIKDHKDTFMHVSPDLSKLRNRFENFGYVNISKDGFYAECDDDNCSKQLFRKTI